MLIDQTVNLSASATVDDHWTIFGHNNKISFLEDPLALAWASYRLWQTNQTTRFTEFDQIQCTDEDHVQAQNMREYYQSRLTFDRLKYGTPLSDFRKKLVNVLEGNRELPSQDYIGLLYRLPYLWIEDRAHDKIFSERPAEIPARANIADQVSEFELIDIVSVSRRGGETMQYWLQSPLSSLPCMIFVKKDNVLNSLLNSVLCRPDTRLRSNWYASQMRGHWRQQYYWRLLAVELV